MNTIFDLTKLSFDDLHSFIIKHYDIEEFRTLCAKLGINFDDLRGEGLQAKAREFILYLKRRNRIIELTKELEGKSQIESINKQNWLINYVKEEEIINLKQISDSIDSNYIPEDQLNVILITIQNIIDEIIEKRKEEFNSYLIKEIRNISKKVKEPKLDLKQKLKYSIPIIPLFLSLEGDIEFKNSFQVKKIWKKLLEIVRDKNPKD